ncbi:MAG: SRPBCC family protein [Bacteroidetes bacterium]|nr:SRPBCC family protein [Bacteroidota bacterium]
MPNNSVTLHRIIKASPDKVFKAFSDANAQTAWLPPYGFLCVVEHFDFKVGGAYRMKFINFSTGNSHSFSGEFVEIKTNEFIKNTDRFDDPNLQGEMTTSVWFKKVLCGTEIKIIQEGIPELIPAEMCYLGWQDSLDKLIKLVEPEIPDSD